MTCKEICYQQWVDMYNEKNKECYKLQLENARLKEHIEKWKFSNSKKEQEIKQLKLQLEKVKNIASSMLP